MKNIIFSFCIFFIFGVKIFGHEHEVEVKNEKEHHETHDEHASHGLDCPSKRVRGKVVGLDGKETISLIGASLHWLGTTEGVVSDMGGNFSIRPSEHTHNLVISYVGYKSDTLHLHHGANVQITLFPEMMDELEINAVRDGSSINRYSAITMIDMNRNELCKAACCSLGESFETNASVDVSYADAATGARTIQMLGLQGRYVQMMTENIPTLRGISSPFGLSYVPGPWMDGIQISKGVGTVVNGFEAMTGQINVEYLKPISDEIFSIDVFGSSAARADVSAIGNIKITDELSTGIMANYGQDFMKMDHNKDGFLDEPKTLSLNFLNRWQYKHGGYTFQAMVKTLNEWRQSGQMAFNSNSSNDSIYGVEIKTDRVEAYLKNGYVFSDKANIGITTSYIYHHQNSIFGQRIYSGTQHSYNFNAIFSYDFSGGNHHVDHAHSLLAGISSQGDIYTELVALQKQTPNRYDLNDIYAGIFFQYTYKFKEKLTLIAGIRGDYSTLYKPFVTPRLHLKYSPWKKTNIRLAVGKGTRNSMLFAENNYLLTSSRKWNFSNVYGQEEAWNMGVNITQYIELWDHNELTLSAEYFHTEFTKGLVIDMDADVRSINVYFTNQRMYADNVQLEAKFSPVKGLDITGAYRWSRNMQPLAGKMQERPLTAAHKGLVAVSYTTPKRSWQFDANVQFCGGGRIPTTAENPEPYQRDSRFKPYQLYNLQVTKWFKQWSIYAGGENISNFTQKNPIIAAEEPLSPYFDSSLIWGPLMGWKVYLGVRFRLEKK